MLPNHDERARAKKIVSNGFSSADTDNSDGTDNEEKTAMRVYRIERKKN